PIEQLDELGADRFGGHVLVASSLKAVSMGLLGSGVRPGWWCAVDLEEQLLRIAPPPVLSRLVRADQGVVVVAVPMRGGVTVGRAVAAAAVAAAHAQAKVDPLPADAQAVLAPVAGRGDVGDGVEVGAGVSHGGCLHLVVRGRRGPSRRRWRPPRRWAA